MKRTLITVTTVAALAITNVSTAAARERATQVNLDMRAPGEPLDLDPTPATRRPSRARQALTLGAVGGMYGALYGWTFMAWHYNAETRDTIEFHDEGWFGADTYAGGADKLGHAWTNYALTRGGARMLQAGGWSKGTSLIASTALAAGFFTFSEIKDGYNSKYGFSPNDMVANLVGNALGVAFELSPWLDERFDFRVQYFPSSAFFAEAQRDGLFNTAEDYTGQTYYLAYHLGSIDALREDPTYAWTKYVDLTVGYHADAFRPVQTDVAPRQDLSIGISFNLQALFDPGFLHFATEVYAPPFTTLPLVQTSRPATGDQAPVAAVLPVTAP